MKESDLQRIRELFLERFKKQSVPVTGDIPDKLNALSKNAGGIKEVEQYMLGILNEILEELNLSPSREEAQQIPIFLENDIAELLKNHVFGQ